MAWNLIGFNLILNASMTVLLTVANDVNVSNFITGLPYKVIHGIEFTISTPNKLPYVTRYCM